MCGIAGIVSNNTGLVSEKRIRAAASCLRHRGPEDGTIWIAPDNTIALGHQRLRILDLSEQAAQPMPYLDRYRIIHNGELYNYIEIRQLLQQKGYAFASASDTEVIVAAYDAWGTECLQRFDGMFAFAIWDEKEKLLFAARDRFGEKPFFFSFDGEQLLFASEIKALWNLGVKKEVNPALLYNFLTLGYTSNPTDPQESFYLTISKLPAASFLTYSVASNQLQLEKYWQLYPERNSSITEAQALEQFDHLFSASIKKRLRSDVAVGTSLSGGIDSSAIVAYCESAAADHYTHKCFTASFKGFQKDERRYAEMVARQYGLEHYVVEMEDSDIPGLMAEVMRKQDEPFSSSSVLAQYEVYRLAKQKGVTVLLDGQGADEILAGYHKYYRWYWQELFRNRKLKSSGERRQASELGVKETFGPVNRIAALFPELAASLLQSRRARQAYHHPDLNRDFAFLHKKGSYYSTPSGFDLDGVLYFNTFVNGLEELLRLADRNSMAHATEVRLPFLSHELVEFLFTLPPQFKIRSGRTKWLLRKAMEGRLPSEIVWRADKTGFEPPQEKWMQQEAVKSAIQEGKEKLVRQGILNEGALKKIRPHTAYAANGQDWKYWSASFLF